MMIISRSFKAIKVVRRPNLVRQYFVVLAYLLDQSVNAQVFEQAGNQTGGGTTRSTKFGHEGSSAAAAEPCR
jgi:hypothetical protein